jgi:three-Cys-motif partner protein
MRNETLYGIDDALFMNEGVGQWSDIKYRLLQLYAHLFTAGMKGKWGALTYIDLYAGAGQSRVEGTGEILLGSPLIALSLDVQFDHYIFCEQDSIKLAALRKRVSENFPQASVTFIEGDCNDTVPQIEDSIPDGALSLCFVDPYDLSIRFETLRLLTAHRNMDFLCLLASRMDAGRNLLNYTAEDSTKVESFLGFKEWRKVWEDIATKKPNFGDFLCGEFGRRMERLGYLPTALHQMKSIKDANRALYHLALFARHPTAMHYWKQVMKYSIPQRSLFD